MARYSIRYKRVQNTSSVKLSDEQKIILDFLTKDFLTVKQIAQKRNTGERAVYKTIKKLKDKGVIIGVQKSSYLEGGGYSIRTPKAEGTYRLHAIAFTVDIIKSSEKYKKILNKRSKDELDNNTLILRSNNITVYTNKDFFDDKPEVCERKSLEYIDRLISMLENNYKITLKKGRNINLRQFRGEIAKTNDPYAQKKNLEHEKVRIYDSEGKLRLLVDNSFGLNELETVNNDKHIEDMQKIRNKWLDLINCDLLLSDVEKHLKVFQHTTNVQNEKFDKMIMIMEKLLNNR